MKPKRTDHFDPGQTTRPLGPFEVFDAMPIDLNDWFDLARPGSYRVHVTFAADSGVGEGSTNDWYFTVGEPGRIGSLRSAVPARGGQHPTSGPNHRWQWAVLPLHDGISSEIAERRSGNRPP